MPQCLKCGAELPVDDEGHAGILCDRCAGQATTRARRSLSAGTMRDYPATTALVAINLAVFLGMVLTGGAILNFSPQQTVLWGANYTPLTVSGQYWRLLTAGFVHAGLLHIAFNMWCLWSLGQLSERLFGRWITIAIYLLTGVGGSLLSLAARPVTFEVGASGAIFGIAGAILSGIKFGKVSVSSLERRSIFSSLIFFVVFNLAIGFGLVGVGVGIDNMCHLGGLISGLIFGVPLASAAASGKKRFEWATMILAALVLAGVGSQVVSAKLRSNPLDVARVQLRQHNFLSAIVTLEKLAVSEPQNAQAQVLLGYAYEMNEERDKAIAAYQRALHIDPNQPDVQQLLDELQGSGSSTK
ncbi:MAG TPA: rhomboid family intramembrane serine protease [Terriglobales bacterium]